MARVLEGLSYWSRLIGQLSHLAMPTISSKTPLER